MSKKWDNAVGSVRRRVRRPNVFDMRSRERVGLLFDAPSEMSVAERLFLYSLVRGSRPLRVLEIGSNHGGSASIMAAAMEDCAGNGQPRHEGKIFGVDPYPRFTIREKDLFGRFTLIKGTSPDAVHTAAQMAGGPFDLVLVDGIHIYKQAKLDIDAIIPHLAADAYVLFHDAFHVGVSEAIAEFINSQSTFWDFGYPCSKPALNVGTGEVAYGGFRMIRVGSAKVIDPYPLIEREARMTGSTLPSRDRDLLDHDAAWYCRVVEPCAYCVKNKLVAGS